MNLNVLKSITCYALLCCVFCMQGCADSNVEAVKNGVLFHYNDAKIGPVFEANFTNTSWTSSNKNGRNCVTFTGKISKATHEKMAKLLDLKDRNVDSYLMQFFPEVYKKTEAEIAKKFQDERDRLNKQYNELEELIEEVSIQESNLEREKSDFEHKFSERKDVTQYRESEIKRTKEKFEKRKIDFQRYKNTRDEAYMKKYLDEAEAEYKDALAQMKVTHGKNAKLQQEYAQWQAQGNEAKIAAVKKKNEELKNKKSALDGLFNKFEDRQIDEINKAKESLAYEIIGKYWEEGDPVEIEFVIHPEGNLEVKEMKCESWNKFKLAISEVLAGIYK